MLANEVHAPRPTCHYLFGSAERSPKRAADTIRGRDRVIRGVLYTLVGGGALW